MIRDELRYELKRVAQRLDDPDFDRALEIVESIIQKPDVAPSAAPIMIAELQAIGFRFAMLKVYYMGIEKDSVKKNLYYSADEAVKKLVDALKYIARV